jgi:hypothetical protein
MRNTLRLQIRDKQVRISSDRVTRAPSREGNPVETPPDSSTASIPPSLRPPYGLPKSQRQKKTVRFLLPEPEVEREYVIERIVDAQSDNAEHPLYRVRWMGCNPEEDTWEPEGNLPSHFIRSYWRKRLNNARTTTAVAPRNFIRPFRYFAPLRSIFAAMVFSNFSYDVIM